MAKATASKTPSKAEFVRSLPPDMSAKDVIAKAKERGMKLTPAYVYVIRSKGGASRKAGKGKGAAGRTGRRNGSIEQQFVSLALDLGFARAQQLLDETRAKIEAAVR